MSIKALLASLLVIGSSTAALAAPTATVNVRTGVTTSVRGHVTTVRDHRDIDGQWFRDHRHPQPKPPVRVVAQPTVEYTYAPTYYPGYELPVPTPAPVASLMTLLAPTQLASRFDLDVTGELAAMSKIRLDATGCEGSTYISKVTIYYTNGNYEQVDIGGYLTASNPTFDLGLSNGAAVTRVTVDGQSQNGGSLAVLAL